MKKNEELTKSVASLKICLLLSARESNITYLVKIECVEVLGVMNRRLLCVDREKRRFIQNTP